MLTKKANLEMQKNFFTIKSTTDWNMLPGEVIDLKLQGKVEETRPTVT